MKAYSLDFRQKIMAVHHAGGTSQRQLAERFDVALSFIEKLIKQEKETGSIAPKRRGGGANAKLTPEHKQIVAELVAADNDATLVELCGQLEKRVGVRVSRSTMGRLTQELNLTVKKTFRATERDREDVLEQRVN